MKKYYYNYLLLLKNINNYGIFEVLKIIFYEIFFIIKFKDFNSLSYDEKESDTYEHAVGKNTYDTPYIPTPFYFLKILCLFFKKAKISIEIVLLSMNTINSSRLMLHPPINHAESESQISPASPRLSPM